MTNSLDSRIAEIVVQVYLAGNVDDSEYDAITTATAAITALIAEETNQARIEELEDMKSFTGNSATESYVFQRIKTLQADQSQQEKK